MLQCAPLLQACTYQLSPVVLTRSDICTLHSKEITAAPLCLAKLLAAAPICRLFCALQPKTGSELDHPQRNVRVLALLLNCIVHLALRIPLQH